ncbi:MAG: carboxypeptidase regulatory-like domain-containing protein [Acidobacteria bacterium]|nr:carboxypeptidase regulatory-like domain-containing protein [Acidobacteriota bacterium]
MDWYTPSSKRRRLLAKLLLGLACLALPASAATPVKFYGKIVGVVTDAAGIPQMGAAVALFDRMEKLLSRAATDERGAFIFDNLLSGAYSVRVSLASFVPVLKSNILVTPGGRSLLNVSLAGLFSSIELVYPSSDQRALMSDEWKWVLRTSSATRPVLRLMPEWNSGRRRTEQTAIFSGTRGLVKVSAGDGGRVTSFGNESDLGTAFALATSLFGTNRLQVSGNLGYASQSGIPSAGFRTTYSRESQHASPEVSITMRQLFLPSRVGAALGGTAGVPALRTLSLSVDDSTQLTDALRFEYGFSLDAVTFFDRLNYLSPYGRLKYAVSKSDTLEFSYSSGVPRSDLPGGSKLRDADLQNQINSLALFPRISLQAGRAKVQRSESFELGYTKTAGSRTYRGAAYRESVSNAALTMAGATDLFPSGDVLPDLFSSSSVFNAGGYHSLGYMASVTQNLGDHLNATLIYGSGGALLPVRGEVENGSPDDLRAMIRQGRRRAVTSQIAGNSPWTGTHFVASYQWTDRRAATPTHYFVTQGTRAEAGLNVYLRQPIPTFFSLPVRLEASADMRNLLAQGYLPFMADGQRLLLMHTPRSVRGGLSFIF